MYTILHDLLLTIVNYAILLFEYTGVIIIIAACFHGIYEYILRRPDTKLNLAKGMAMGLEFKLGSEMLRTVTVREFREILIVASIIVLHALLTLLIQWGIKTEKSASSSPRQED